MKLSRPAAPVLVAALLAVAPSAGGVEAQQPQVQQVTGVVTPYVHEVREPGATGDEVQVIDTGEELVPLVGTPLPDHAEVTVEVVDVGGAHEVREVLESEPADELGGDVAGGNGSGGPLLRQRAAAGRVHDVHVAFVLPRGASSADDIASREQVQAAMARVDDYWSSQTGGAVSFRVASMTGGYASAYSCAGEGAWRMWEEADARLGGVRGRPASHLMLVLPRKAYTELGCSYALGSVGASVDAGGDLYVATAESSAMAHELGHNMGLNHSGSLVCTDRQDATVADAADCAVREYDDYLDVMSSSGAIRGTGALNAAHVDDLGLLPASIVTVRGAGEQTVRLSPLASLAGVRAVKVVDAGSTYFVQYRTRAGRDAAAPAAYEMGVEVVRGENPWAQPASFAATSSLALDATPSGSENGVTRALPVGSSFTSVAGGVEVEVLDQDDAGATVLVRVAAPADDAARARPAKVAIEAPASAKANTLFRTAGTVTDQRGKPLGGVDLHLQRRAPGGTWTTIARVNANAAGKASVPTRITSVQQFRWAVPRTSAWASVASPARQVRVG